LPGPITKTDEDLIKAIKNVKTNEYDTKYKIFNEKYNYLEDGKASKRVIDTLKK